MPGGTFRIGERVMAAGSPGAVVGFNGRLGAYEIKIDSGGTEWFRESELTRARSAGMPEPEPVDDRAQVEAGDHDAYLLRRQKMHHGWHPGGFIDHFAELEAMRDDPETAQERARLGQENAAEVRDRLDDAFLTRQMERLAAPQQARAQARELAAEAARRRDVIEQRFAGIERDEIEARNIEAIAWLAEHSPVHEGPS